MYDIKIIDKEQKKNWIVYNNFKKKVAFFKNVSYQDVRGRAEILPNYIVLEASSEEDTRD